MCHSGYVYCNRLFPNISLTKYDIQAHYNSIKNGDNDGKNNSSATMNNAFKRLSKDSKSFHSLVRDIHSFKIMQNKRKIERDSGSKIRMRSQDVIERFNQVKTILRDFETLSPSQKEYELQYILRDLGSV